MTGAARLRQRLRRAETFMAAVRTYFNVARRADLLYPTVTDVAVGRRILVLAPHPDDDVIGCGGAIAKLRAADCDVRIVYMTDGREGPKGYPDQRELVCRRRTEAVAGAKRLRVEENALLFWEEPDRTLIRSQRTVAMLRSILTSYRPDAVYLPFFLDYNPDHAAANEIFAAAAGCDAEFKCVAYFIVPSLHANLVLDISEEFRTKEEALAEHRTQVETFPFLEATRALNEFWARRHGLGGHAEAFFCAPQRCYVELFRESRMLPAPGAIPVSGTLTP